MFLSRLAQGSSARNGLTRARRWFEVTQRTRIVGLNLELRSDVTHSKGPALPQATPVPQNAGTIKAVPTG